jgi:hypothetical protein
MNELTHEPHRFELELSFYRIAEWFQTLWSIISAKRMRFSHLHCFTLSYTFPGLVVINNEFVTRNSRTSPDCSRLCIIVILSVYSEHKGVKENRQIEAPPSHAMHPHVFPFEDREGKEGFLVCSDIIFTKFLIPNKTYFNFFFFLNIFNLYYVV